MQSYSTTVQYNHKISPYPYRCNVGVIKSATIIINVRNSLENVTGKKKTRHALISRGKPKYLPAYNCTIDVRSEIRKIAMLIGDTIFSLFHSFKWQR